jgi:hypothetical protein
VVVTEITRKSLAIRRQRRDLLAIGYEEVGEGGGLLWQLERGARQSQRIVDAVISVGGKSVFVKIQ